MYTSIADQCSKVRFEACRTPQSLVKFLLLPSKLSSICILVSYSIIEQWTPKLCFSRATECNSRRERQAGLKLSRGWDVMPCWDRSRVSLALKYTAEDGRRQERVRKRERVKQRHTLSLLSLVSKQMSTRLLSLLQYKGPLTNTLILAQRHAHASSWINQCLLLSVISQGSLLHPPWGKQGDKANQRRRENLSFCPPFFLSFFHFLSCFLVCTTVFYNICTCVI